MNDDGRRLWCREDIITVVVGMDYDSIVMAPADELDMEFMLENQSLFNDILASAPMQSLKKRQLTPRLVEQAQYLLATGLKNMQMEGLLPDVTIKVVIDKTIKLQISVLK